LMTSGCMYCCTLCMYGHSFNILVVTLTSHSRCASMTADVFACTYMYRNRLSSTFFKSSLLNNFQCFEHQKKFLSYKDIAQCNVFIVHIMLSATKRYDDLCLSLAWFYMTYEVGMPNGYCEKRLLH